MDTFAQVIACWTSAESLASDLGLRGVTVRQWRNRNSIPPRYWPSLVRAATARGRNEVTLDVLARIAAAQLPRAASEAA